MVEEDLPVYLDVSKCSAVPSSMHSIYKTGLSLIVDRLIPSVKDKAARAKLQSEILSSTSDNNKSFFQFVHGWHIRRWFTNQQLFEGLEPAFYSAAALFAAVSVFSYKSELSPLQRCMFFFASHLLWCFVDSISDYLEEEADDEQKGAPKSGAAAARKPRAAKQNEHQNVWSKGRRSMWIHLIEHFFAYRELCGDLSLAVTNEEDILSGLSASSSVQWRVAAPTGRTTSSRRCG